MKLKIKNFRSIKKQEIELAPMTVVYGPNGAGKSSLLYALLTLKNVVMNPNQTPEGFFNYTFMNLGDFEAVVFDHQVRDEIELGTTLAQDALTLTYQVTIGANRGNLALSVGDKDVVKVQFPLSVSFPYPANQHKRERISLNQRTFAITWNGITAQVQQEHTLPPPPPDNPPFPPELPPPALPPFPGMQDQEIANRLAVLLNSPLETLRKVGIVPLKRGFSKPSYSTVPVSPLIITEDEIATLLSSERYLEPKVSLYLERILARDFRVHVTPGTSLFSLDSTDRETGLACELVNEGFGINQTVYLLAKCLHRETEWVCIEEPEIHLHPAAVRGMAKVFAQMIHNEGKRFLISTHSESFVLALLTLVTKGELNPSELACYLARKEGNLTQLERQSVDEKGQIEGGLASFMAGELEDISAFLKVAK